MYHFLLRFPDVNNLFHQPSIRSGQLLLVAHLQLISGAKVLRDFLDGIQLTGLWGGLVPSEEDDKGLCVNFIGHTEADMTMPISTTEQRTLVCPKGSVHVRGIMDTVLAIRREKRRVLAIAVVDEVLCQSEDNGYQQGFSHSVRQLREFCLREDILFILIAQLGHEALKMSRVIGPGWINQVRGNGYYLRSRNLEQEADLALVVDYPGDAPEIIRVAKCKERGRPYRRDQQQIGIGLLKEGKQGLVADEQPWW